MISTLSLCIIAIACMTALSCALLGCFLMLRGAALMSDAISHAILPGIVITFLLVHDVESPLLLIGALITGMCAVISIEQITYRTTLKKDAAIGCVFPFFFSVGVILIHHRARNVHLDMDMVLLGELVFAPFNRLVIGATDYGPYALWSSGACTLGTLLFIYVFYKELHITTFDSLHAYTLGMNPQRIHYPFIVLTTIIIIHAFNSVGAIAVIALMLLPAATGYIYTQRLPTLLLVSCLAGVAAALGGYTVAWYADVSIAGAIVCVGGIILVYTLITAPQKGLWTYLHTWHAERRAMEQQLIDTYRAKNRTHNAQHIATALNWSVKKVNRYI